ncbi:MAG TPA: hypothetical protein VL361_28515 [Candidatus Limnocylindrales bacterium]|jgi:hypothetical protein|nr:hypothetical protein [Candidatus Limnocylindrales bacterium]
MPDEAERAIEKLLRACAKQRRGEEPLTLHPATRRLLQAEVGHVFHNRPAESTGFLSRFLSLSLGPKLAWSAGVFLVFAITTWSIVSSHRSSQRARLLARSDKTTQQTSSASRLQLAAPATTPVNLADARQAENKVQSSQDIAKEPDLQSVSKPEIASRYPAQGAMPEMLKKDAETSGLSRPTLNAPAGNVAPVVTYSSAASSIGAAGQSFSAPTRLFFQESSNEVKLIEKDNPQPILASFQWEQSGSAIRVVDQDGSVYSGSLQMAPRQLSRVEQRRSLSPQKRAADASANSTAPEVFFQVSGTNRSLQRLVVFNGRFFVPTNSGTEAVSTNLFRDAGRSLGGAITRAPVSQISGTAVIGGTQQVSINAVAAKP